MTDPKNNPGGGRLPVLVAVEDAPRPALRAGLAVLLVAVAALIGADVAGDVRSGASAGHVALELVLMALTLLGVTALVVQLALARRRARLLLSRLGRAEQEMERFRAEARAHLEGLAVAIDRQLARWTLTPAEREVALLLLKGLSHKEIAGLRGTSERTIRQQALAVYRKAGLAGRAELAAFFLEDLLLPAGPPAEP